tara:strand:+ start:2076 stop:3344 length:1269 start_codon:yes stop_codon:yes gene_type:complete
MQYRLRQILIDNLIVFLLVMSSGSLLFVFQRNIMYIVFLLILILAFIPFDKLKKPVFQSAFLTFSSFIILFLINYIFAITEQEMDKYIYYMIVLSASGLTLTHFFNNRDSDIFLRRLYLILKIIMIHSIINLFAFLYVKNQLVTISNLHHECQTFNNIFFYSSLQKKYALISFLGIDFYRNQGLFWEPGVLQVFLNIYLYLEAFVFKKSRFLIALTILAILSTYSTTAIIILLIQLIFYMITEMKNSKILIPFVLILSIPIYLVFSTNIKEKIIGEKEASFQKRYFDLVQPFFISIQHPLTGIGLDFKKYKEFRSEFYFSSNTFDFIRDETGVDLKVENTEEGISNSFMFLLSSMGFPTFFLLMVMFFKQNLFNKRKSLIYMIIILSLMSSPLLLRPFFLIIIISGFYEFFSKFKFQNKQFA